MNLRQELRASILCRRTLALRLCLAALLGGVLFGSLHAINLDYIELQQSHKDDANFRKQAFIWMKGEDLIRSKNVLEGIRLLDSLRVTGFDEREFISDYARDAFHVFIPAKTDSGLAANLEVRRWFGLDTSLASSFRCDITRPLLSQYPCFIYSATFVFRKPFPLVFMGLSYLPYPSALLQFYGKDPPSPVGNILADEFYDRQEKARCLVCIDLNDTKSPFMQYIGDRINGVYNTIKTGSDLARYHALSLRCFRYDNFRGQKGDFAAFIVFDRSIGDILKITRGNRQYPEKDLEKKIRFTVSVQSGIDVQDQAEAKLQTVLDAF